MNKQLLNEVRSENFIIFNFANIGNVWGSYCAKVIIRITFFCSKSMRCLGFRFCSHAVQTFESGNEK